MGPGTLKHNSTTAGYKSVLLHPCMRRCQLGVLLVVLHAQHCHCFLSCTSANTVKQLGEMKVSCDVVMCIPGSARWMRSYIFWLGACA